MSVRFTFERNELVAKFSGLMALTGLIREIKIPYCKITGVEVGGFKERIYGLPLGGTSFPSYKTGRFFHKGQKYFLFYRNATDVLMIQLKDHIYDMVVIQTETPRQIADEIMDHLSD